MRDADLARRALALLDLTNLNDACADQDVEALCARAATAHGSVAAVCVWPRFVKLARARLKGTPVRVATVVNFPAGGEDVEAVCEETEKALRAGADEIDLVLPWRAFLAGDAVVARSMIGEALDLVEDEGKLLKVILESGEYPDQAAVRRAAELSIDAGAHFLKTSTGKTATSATPTAAATMLKAIRAADRPVGLKPSGGIRSLADARAYLDLADAMMGPGWASPGAFRFGASGLLDALLAAIAGEAGPAVRESY